MTMPSNKWEEALDIIIQDMLVQYTAWVNGEPVPWNVKKEEAKAQISQLIKEARIDEQSRTMIIDECLVFDTEGFEPLGQPQAERLAALQGK